MKVKELIEKLMNEDLEAEVLVCGYEVDGVEQAWRNPDPRMRFGTSSSPTRSNSEPVVDITSFYRSEC